MNKILLGLLCIFTYNTFFCCLSNRRNRNPYNHKPREAVVEDQLLELYRRHLYQAVRLGEVGFSAEEINNNFQKSYDYPIYIKMAQEYTLLTSQDDLKAKLRQETERCLKEDKQIKFEKATSQMDKEMLKLSLKGLSAKEIVNEIKSLPVYANFLDTLLSLGDVELIEKFASDYFKKYHDPEKNT